MVENVLVLGIKRVRPGTEEENMEDLYESLERKDQEKMK